MNISDKCKLVSELRQLITAYATAGTASSLGGRIVCGPIEDTIVYLCKKIQEEPTKGGSNK